MSPPRAQAPHCFTRFTIWRWPYVPNPTAQDQYYGLERSIQGVQGERAATEATRHTDKGKGTMDNSQDRQPARSFNQQSEQHSARSGDWRNNDREIGARPITQHRSAGRSDGPQCSCPHSHREDSQGLLPDEKCEVSSGGGALTVVNTRTGERTTYRVAQKHKVSPPRKENVKATLGSKKRHSPE